ncbi:MAG: MFS transporter [Bacteroidia bacterium]|nr:MFS transporter [Bacteroidia bacterium]
MKNKTIALIANFTGILLFGISMVIIGSLLPMLKIRFGMTDIAAGSLFSILPIGLLVGSVTFGPIVDKFGYRWVLSTASVFLSLGFFGIAHSESINLLRTCVFFFGMGGGVINGGTSALVSDLSEGKNKIINLNWLGMFYGIGAFSMPLILSRIGEIYYTAVIDVVSGISLLIAVVFLLINYPLTVQKEKISIKLIPVFVKNKLFMVICFYLFFQSAFEAVINNWSVSFFINKLAVSQNQALMALSLSILGLICMRILTGSVLKNWHHLRLVRLSLLLFSLGLICLIIPASYYVHLLGMFLIGGGLAPGFPVMLGVVGEIFKEVSGTAFSFAMLIALTGNIIINYLIGILTENFGMGIYPYVILTEIVMMMLIFLLVRKADKTSS